MAAHRADHSYSHANCDNESDRGPDDLTMTWVLVTVFVCLLDYQMRLAVILGYTHVPHWKHTIGRGTKSHIVIAGKGKSVKNTKKSCEVEQR
jgi:hypothetical protein